MMIDQTTFKTIAPLKIRAYKSSANFYTFNFKPVGSYIGVSVNHQAYLDFTANNCDRVDVIINGEVLTAPNVVFDGPDLKVRFGASTQESGSYEYIVAAYFAGATDPVILHSGNRVELMELLG